MKQYVIITYGIDVVGGTVLYVLHKSNYLIEQGWKVLIFDGKRYATGNPFPGLEKIAYNFPFLEIPPYKMSKSTVHKSIHCMVNVLDAISSDRIVIESHGGCFPLWGELIASETGGKHICATMTEGFKSFQPKLPFFSFKLDRGELSGGENLKLLFGDYRTITERDYRPFWIDEDPVADVYNEAVASIQPFDFNICYIGRIVKCYPSILDGVRIFAANHPDKRIQMVFVGELKNRKAEIYNVFAESPNVTILELGDLIPIPKMLFDKVDVTIATSGSARCAAYEGALAIVADADNHLSNGLLGYETKESVRAETAQTTFDVALERALIERVQDGMEFDYSKPGVAACCEQNFEFIRNSNQEKVYYDENLLLDHKGLMSDKGPIRNELWFRYPKMMKLLSSIKRRLRGDEN